MQGGKITQRETFLVHELLMRKTVCANKAAMFSSMVQDQQLRGLIDNDLNQAKQQIQELKGFISASEWSGQSGGTGGINYSTSSKNFNT